MLTETEMLQKTEGLEPKERAAALAHYIYSLTYTLNNGSWEPRVPTDWNDLSEDAREFNLASAQMWAQSKDILKAWLDAVKAIENQ